MNTIREINTDTEEGKLLLAAISMLTIGIKTSDNPDECLNEIQKVADKIYGQCGDDVSNISTPNKPCDFYNNTY